MALRKDIEVRRVRTTQDDTPHFRPDVDAIILTFPKNGDEGEFSASMRVGAALNLARTILAECSR